MASEKLFNEFAPIPTEKWEEIINKDLDGGTIHNKVIEIKIENIFAFNIK